MSDNKMAQHESPCTKYIYGPIEGDYERWIPPGTPFEDLPEEWTCPLCDAEKEFFEELDD
jgi:rubredoxin